MVDDKWIWHGAVLEQRPQKGKEQRVKRWQRPREEAAAVARRGTEKASAAMATRKQVQEALQRKKEGAQSRGACLDLENDVAEETMSAVVKLAKDPLEPDDIDQQTPERRDDSRPVQGGGENTDEHTEMCEKSEKRKEGYDVGGHHAPQSDETAGILEQWKDETSADSTALEKKGLEKTDRQGLMKAETLPRATRPPPRRDKQAAIEYGRKSKKRCDSNESMLWLAASYLEYKATIQEGVMNFMRLFNNLERVGAVQKTIPEELKRYGLFRNRKHMSRS